MVHAAAAYAKAARRLRRCACTSSIGPGATNMVTGAAAATINRLPVLLLPGDMFATRRVDPGAPAAGARRSPATSRSTTRFRPVSRYWDRIDRPEQLLDGAARGDARPDRPGGDGRGDARLPQDVQAEACDFPDELFERRVWHVAAAGARRRSALARGRGADPRRPPAAARGRRRCALLRCRPTRSRAFAEATGIPVAETQAGKGALPYDHPCSLGAIGRHGTPRRQPRGPRRRPGHRRRHALQRLHHGLADRLPGIPASGSWTSTWRALDAAKRARAARCVADARAGLEALRPAP